MTHWYKSPKPKRKERSSPPTTPVGEHSDLFTVYCKNELGYEPVKEYRFHPVRKWRFDYAIPSLKIAIECDGGVWTGGRHVRPQGYIREMEKFNAAAELGWVVLKFTPQQIMTHDTIVLLRTTIKRRVEELAKQFNDQTQ